MTRLLPSNNPGTAMSPYLHGLLPVVVLVLLLGPAAGGEPEKPTAVDIERLVKQLGSSQFREREDATQALDALGVRAFEALQKAATGSDDAEVRRRANRLLLAIAARERTRLLDDIARWGGHVDVARDRAVG